VTRASATNAIDIDEGNVVYSDVKRAATATDAVARQTTAATPVPTSMQAIIANAITLCMWNTSPCNNESNHRQPRAPRVCGTRASIATTKPSKGLLRKDLKPPRSPTKEQLAYDTPSEVSNRTDRKHVTDAKNPVQISKRPVVYSAGSQGAQRHEKPNIGGYF